VTFTEYKIQPQNCILPVEHKINNGPHQFQKL